MRIRIRIPGSVPLTNGSRSQSAIIISVCSTHLWEKGRIRIRTSDQWVRIREAEKHADPQHCWKLKIFFNFSALFLVERVGAPPRPWPPAAWPQPAHAATPPPYPTPTTLCPPPTASPSESKVNFSSCSDERHFVLHLDLQFAFVFYNGLLPVYSDWKCHVIIVNTRIADFLSILKQTFKLGF